MNTTPTTATADRAFLCIRCGYTLFGLTPEGKCPECGTPVERSMRGDLLEYCGEEYLASLHKGLFWIQTSIIVMIVSSILIFIYEFVARGNFLIATSTGGTTNSTAWSPGFSVGLIEPISLGIDLLLAAMSVWGWWRMSTPDPGQLSTNKGDGARRLIRITIVVAGVNALVQFVATFLHLPTAQRLLHILGQSGSTMPATPEEILELSLAVLAGFIRVFAFAAWVVAFFAAMNYIMWLAPRIPSARIYEGAKRLRWLGPLLYVMLLPCIVIGPLIALVLYYNLLDKLRVSLRAIRAKAGVNPLAAST